MQFIKSILRGVAVTIGVIAVLIFIVALAAPSPDEVLTEAQTSVAADFERQYQDAAIHGTPIDRCVRAGLVAEGYLQAGDSESYGHWKQVEREECLRAGVPR